MKRLSAVKIILSLTLLSCSNIKHPGNSDNQGPERFVTGLRSSEKDFTVKKADSIINLPVITITQFKCERSAGGLHDFYSEGPYWWPDPAKPEGPYIRKDGYRNPQNFTAHDDALARFSDIVSVLTGAYILTGKDEYVKRSIAHLDAWLCDTATMMNPNMLYAQAIKGVCTGRGIGIIDAIPLVDVARSVSLLEKSSQLTAGEISGYKKWFAQFLNWLTTHKYGIDEMNAKNNHGTWYLAQVAAYAQLTGNTEIIQLCRKRYTEVILPGQIDISGSQPLELERTKPYSYSLFNLDAMALLCWIISDKDYDAWNYSTSDGRSLSRALDYMYRYLTDISSWPHGKDVADWEKQPGQRNFMFFNAVKTGSEDWFNLWKKLGEKKDRRAADRVHLVLWADIKNN